MSRGNLGNPRKAKTAAGAASTTCATTPSRAPSASVRVPVTEEVTAYIDPRPRGIRLALAELHQLRAQPALAREHLRLILVDRPEDVVVKAALAELLLEAEPVPGEDADRVLHLSVGLENATPVHAALLRAQLMKQHSGAVPWSAIQPGFGFEGEQVYLGSTPRGIHRPAQMQRASPASRRPN